MMVKLTYKTLKLLILGIGFFFASMSEAKAYDVPPVHSKIHRKMKDVQETTISFMALSDSLANQMGDELTPFDLFPALDLYGTWNDDHVDPTIGQKSVVIPNKADIDVSTFFPPIKGRVTSPYGWRWRRMHKGVDLKLYVGDTVRAAFDGQVRIRKFDRRGYGYYYVVRHPNGLETVYGHLSGFIAQKDQYVRAGQPIGLGGSTGRSTGPHLHLEFRYMGIAINPSEIIDFDTFMPKSDIYHFDLGKARYAASGRGRVSSGGGGGASGSGVHRVRSGDTLGGIARRYGTTVSRLCHLNGIRSNATLRIGQRIRYK